MNRKEVEKMTKRTRKVSVLAAGIVMTVALLGFGLVQAADIQEDPTPAPRANLSEAFGELTDEQKAEIYEITDESESLRDKVLDKLVEFGVIDQETAETAKDHRASRYQEMKDSGEFFGGRKGARGSENGRGGMRARGGNAGQGECPFGKTPQFEAEDNN